MNDDFGTPLSTRLRMAVARVKGQIRFFIGKLLPPVEKRKNAVIGYDTCPRCGELVYSNKQCVYCGQRFINREGVKK